MAIPAGMVTRTIETAPICDALGKPISGAKATLISERSPIWQANGQVFLALPLETTTDSQGVARWTEVPNPAQDGWTDGTGSFIRDWSMSVSVATPPRAPDLPEETFVLEGGAGVYFVRFNTSALRTSGVVSVVDTTIAQQVQAAADAAAASVIAAAAAAASIGRGLPNGVAPLDSGSQVPALYLPSVLRSRTDARPIGQNEEVFNPLHFGAVGDNVANDTAAIVTMLDAIEVGYRGRKFARAKIYLPQGYIFNISSPTPPRLKIPNVSITGGGSFSNGRLQVGFFAGETAVQLNCDISGISFQYSAFATANNQGLEVLRARAVWVRNCTFIQCDAGVYVDPNQNYGFHDLSQIKILDNQFVNCNYMINAQVYQADLITNTNRWMTLSDWIVQGNYGNVAVIDAIHFDCIDGIKVDNNTTFAVGSTHPLANTKQRSLYIGKSNWVNITNNHFFEAGLEGILLNDCQYYVITGNEIAWAGQREPRDGIRITGTMQNQVGIIGHNLVSLYTRHGISVESTGTGSVVVDHNNVFYAATNGFYIGAAFGFNALSSYQHYSVYQPRNTNVICNADANMSTSDTPITEYIKGRNGAQFNVARRQAVSGTQVSTTVSTAGATVNIAQMESITNSSASYDGMVMVSARRADTDNTPSAVYTLLVSKSGAGRQVLEMGKLGQTAGASASDPSFTFAFDSSSEVLQATSVGSTAGLFFFHITTIGNIQAVKI